MLENNDHSHWPGFNHYLMWQEKYTKCTVKFGKLNKIVYFINLQHSISKKWEEYSIIIGYGHLQQIRHRLYVNELLRLQRPAKRPHILKPRSQLPKWEEGMRKNLEVESIE
jgi:predicted acetyltransferase